MVILISYDLNKHERPSSYAKVEKMIRDNVGETKYIKALYSQWLVETVNRPQVWSDRMKKVTDSNDCWLISKIHPGDYSGWLNTDVVNWLEARV